MKITKRQLRRIVKEAIDPRYQEGPPGGWEAYMAKQEADAAERERSSKHDQKTLEFINPAQQYMQKYLDLAQELNLTVVENTPRLLLMQGLEQELIEFEAFFNDMEGGGYHDSDNKYAKQSLIASMKPVAEITKRRLRQIIIEALDAEAFQPLKSFKIPYRNYGYEGRKILDRDRAWLEFVPQGSPPLTPEDMFRAVTLLDIDDPEIELATTTGMPKSMGPLESYNVYSVYSTTTG